uniref:Uncharacterized protein n=1 Tax=Glossina pallidipes TaxID=7398 RepID=A0A1A9ZZP5_GLOPL
MPEIPLTKRARNHVKQDALFFVRLKRRDERDGRNLETISSYTKQSETIHQKTDCLNYCTHMFTAFDFSKFQFNKFQFKSFFLFQMMRFTARAGRTFCFLLFILFEYFNFDLPFINAGVRVPSSCFDYIP